MPFIKWYIGGPPPTGYEGHPQKVIESLGMKVLDYRGCMMGDFVVAQVDKIVDDLPDFLEVVDDWPSAVRVKADPLTGRLL